MDIFILSEHLQNGKTFNCQKIAKYNIEVTFNVDLTK